MVFVIGLRIDRFFYTRSLDGTGYTSAVRFGRAYRSPACIVPTRERSVGGDEPVMHLRAWDCYAGKVRSSSRMKLRRERERGSATALLGRPLLGSARDLVSCAENFTFQFHAVSIRPNIFPSIASENILVSRMTNILFFSQKILTKLCRKMFECFQIFLVNQHTSPLHL